VDMAKLKAELKHQHHRRGGGRLRERLFADVDRLAAAGSALAPISNLVSGLSGARRLLESTLGIASERSLPTFRRRTFLDRFGDRPPAVDADEATERVLVFPDTFTNYVDPATGAAAVEVLEAAGCRVRVPTGVAPSGRAAYSTGYLELARERAGRNVEALAPYAADGWAIAFVEPSDAAMFQDEYGDLLDGPEVERVRERAFGVCEFLDVYGLDEGLPVREPAEHLTYHGHCNQKALDRAGHAVAVLRRAGYAVDALDSGCCGMAGSFGYEADHYDLSRAIGRVLFEQVEASPGETVVAPGTSCRTQLADRPGGERPAHPVEKLAEVLAT